MSNNNSTLETAIKRAALSGFTIQQTAGETAFPYRIIGPAVTREGLAEVLDIIDQHRFGADKPECDDETTLVRQILERVESCRMILDTQDLPENDPSLPTVLKLATVLDEKLGGLTGVESVTDERTREAGDESRQPAGEPAETYDSLKETVAGNIRMVAAEHDDPKVQEDAERIASNIENEGKEPDEWLERFGDPAALEHYAHRDREASGNISGGSAYEDLTLRLSRVDTILQSLMDIEMGGYARNVVSLIDIARSEVAAADRIAAAKSEQWDDPEKPAARDSEMAELLNAQETALSKALDEFPYQTDNEAAISKINRASMLIGAAVELIEAGTNIAGKPAD